ILPARPLPADVQYGWRRERRPPSPRRYGMVSSPRWLRRPCMLRSWKIGRFWGIELFVHWTFFLLPLYVFLMTASRGVPVALFFVAGVLLLFGCVVLHEFGHALTARRFGIPTRDITMYPIGGVARMERMSEKPWEEFWIAIAGPMVNVVIALLI